MPRTRFKIDDLTGGSDTLARILPADQLFTWLCHSVMVPPGWVALVTRSGDDPLLVEAGHRCKNRDGRDVLFARITPVECEAAASDLRSADGLECRGTARVPIRILPEPAELAAFRRTLLGSSNVATIADLRRYLHASLRAVLLSLAACHGVRDLLATLDAAAVQKAVDTALGPVCLAAGLTLDGPVTAHFDSPAYRDQCHERAHAARRRERQAARVQIQEALAAAQRQHLTDLVAMLEQMCEVSERRGDLSVTDLLRTFNDAQRGQMYAALWHLCPAAVQTRYVAAVSGPHVLLFDPRELGRPVRQVRLPETLGPLRSITVDARSLEAGVVLIGAATGVFVVDLQTGQVRQSLKAAVEPARTVRTGVNAAAMSDDRIFATHSELGLLVWPRDPREQALGHPLRPDLTAGAQAVRGAHVAHGAVWFTADAVLWSLPLHEAAVAEPLRYAAGDAALSAVALTDETVYGGNVDGQIIAWNVGDPASARVIRGRAPAPVESIDVVEAGGVEHLIIADRSSALQALVVGDNYACRYESGGPAVRRVAAAADLFVAMNDNRDRLIAWNPRDPARPTATVIIPHLTASTIQDLCLIPTR